MTKDGYFRICVILAAAELRERDLFDFVARIDAAGPKSLLYDIDTVKRMLAAVNSDFIHQSLRMLPSLDTEVARKIERLLLEEAGLPKSQAVILLSQRLEKDYPAVQIPSESKKGFSNWIWRLCQMVPESRLLHIATGLRNELVHSPATDWRLK